MMMRKIKKQIFKQIFVGFSGQNSFREWFTDGYETKGTLPVIPTMQGLY